MKNTSNPEHDLELVFGFLTKLLEFKFNNT